jgi:hypothetical protein
MKKIEKIPPKNIFKQILKYECLKDGSWHYGQKKVFVFLICSESDPSDDSSSKLEEKTNTQNLQNSENLPGVSFT